MVLRLYLVDAEHTELRARSEDLPQGSLTERQRRMLACACETLTADGISSVALPDGLRVPTRYASSIATTLGKIMFPTFPGSTLQRSFLRSLSTFERKAGCERLSLSQDTARKMLGAMESHGLLVEPTAGAPLPTPSAPPLPPPSAPDKQTDMYVELERRIMERLDAALDLLRPAPAEAPVASAALDEAKARIAELEAAAGKAETLGTRVTELEAEIAQAQQTFEARWAQLMQKYGALRAKHAACPKRAGSLGLGSPRSLCDDRVSSPAAQLCSVSAGAINTLPLINSASQSPSELPGDCGEPCGFDQWCTREAALALLAARTQHPTLGRQDAPDV